VPLSDGIDNGPFGLHPELLLHAVGERYRNRVATRSNLLKSV
jgi:hypothetical protein